ncbi:hypothetical protein Goshw_022960 [Gossypium schwendimanii]|uniref:Cytochrome b-c1 complex subunit 8 n=1 Tax=Gossypium schwendimanii TaxID=34291 RepID=A0A7J9MUP0_GOSSC|nr:hypothetical protein [Gossypium schwendimanii]
MGKQPVKMRAVVYALSPFQQKIMSGLWKDLPGKISHKVSENWISATLLLTPLAEPRHTSGSMLPYMPLVIGSYSVNPLGLLNKTNPDKG